MIAAPNAHQRRRHRPSSGHLEVLVVLVLAVMVLGAAMGSTPRHERFPTTTVLVHEGDTLWELAARTRVPGMTTVQTAELIVSLNGLPSAELQRGTSLVVPNPQGSGAVALR